MNQPKTYTMKELYGTVMQLVNTDHGMFKRSTCGHYWRQRRHKSADGKRWVNWERCKAADAGPYVVVTHKATGRSFCMDRNYNLLPFNPRVPKQAVVKWIEKSWSPTDCESQRPAWARHLGGDDQFHAVWYE